MLARIAALVAPDNAAALAAAAQHAREIPQPQLTTMAERTVALYERAIAARGARALDGIAPLAPARVRDALGYAPWSAPRPEPAATSPGRVEGPTAHANAKDASSPPGASPTPSGGVLGAVARLAIHVRPTIAGRILHRLTPASVLDALKARLR
jgi:hypothetical protein